MYIFYEFISEDHYVMIFNKVQLTFFFFPLILSFTCLCGIALIRKSYIKDRDGLLFILPNVWQGVQGGPDPLQGGLIENVFSAHLEYSHLYFVLFDGRELKGNVAINVSSSKEIRA